MTTINLGTITPPTVPDQAYDPLSTRAQAGVAVWSAISQYSLKPYSSVTNMLADDIAGKNNVGNYTWTASYHGIPASVDDWAKGANLYVLLDGGGSRPAEDGGHIIHVGNAGLYRKGLFPNGVDICQFGADGTGLETNITNNSPYVQAAVNYVQFTGRELYVPKSPRSYDCADQIEFTLGSDLAEDNSSKFTSTALTIRGESPAGGVYRAWKGSVLRYTGTAGQAFINVDYSVYASEGHKFIDLVLACDEGSRADTAGIRLKQSGVNSVYPRQQMFTNMGFDGFDRPIVVEGDTNSSPLAAENYYGPIALERVHTWNSKTAVTVDHAVLNLLTMSKCLFHGCIDYGIDSSQSAINLHISDTHFEGCAKASHKLGVYQSDIVMDNVSAENCGVTYTGYFEIDPGPMATRVTIASRLYEFSYMPRTIHLGRDCHISCAGGAIDVSGWGWTTDTPDRIRVVPFEYTDENDVDAANEDISYACDISGHARTSGKGQDLYPAELTGSIFTEDNTNMPSQLQRDFFGTLDQTPIYTGTDYVIDTDGYIYLTFYGKASGVLGANGLSTNSAWPIGGNEPANIQEGYTHKEREGTFVMARKVTAGMGTMTSIRINTTYEYAVLGSLVFSESPLRVSEMTSGVPRSWLA